MKTYKIDFNNNHIIVNPDTPEEINITLTEQECDYCIYNHKTCGNFKGYAQYCDWQTFTSDYVDVG